MNLLEIANMTEDDARTYLENLRWPNGPVCPNCEKQNVTRMQGKSHRKGCSNATTPNAASSSRSSAARFSKAARYR